MTRDQKVVAVGGGSGLLTMLLGLWLLYNILPAPQAAGDLAGRLGYALRWMPVAALPLFLMVAAVANARFSSEAIDPTLGLEDRAMVVNARVADNSVQQFLLFFAGSLGLAASLPPEHMTVIGAAAIVFAACRVAFWIGYRIHPLYRAFGFTSTAWLNLGLLVAALWLAIA